MTRKISAIFLAFIYSVIYVVVGPIIKAQNFKLGISHLFAFLVCFLLCFLINIFVFSIIPRCSLSMRNEKISQYLDKIGENKLFVGVWIFIFVSWIPAYLTVYPGILSYDMIAQVGAALGEINLNHHPVLHTWLIRFFMKTGDMLFSGYEYGIGLLSLLQMLVLSYALTRLVVLLKKKSVPILIVILTAFFSAIWFMNACLSVTMIKDTLHAAFLVLFVCHFVEIVMNPSEYTSQKRNLLLFPLVSFLMCAFRNNGIHIYVFCFAFLFVLRISQIKKVKAKKAFWALIVAILLPVLMYKIYTGPVFAALEIRQGEIREALSVPIQQLQRVAIHEADELSSEQTELMNYYIDNLEWREWAPGREYNPFIADPAKSCFYSNSYNNDPIAFWKFYLQTGKQFPREYLVAFLSNTLGYWYPGYYGFSYVAFENYPPETFVEPLERKSIGNLHVFEKYYESVCTSEFWRSTPVLRLFFVPAYTFWFLIYALVLSWRKRGFFTRVLPLLLPLIAQYGIMILSPMSSFRYSWPFYLILPLSFIAIFDNEESLKWEEKSTEKCLKDENDTCNS